MPSHWLLLTAFGVPTVTVQLETLTFCFNGVLWVMFLVETSSQLMANATVTMYNALLPKIMKYFVKYFYHYCVENDMHLICHLSTSHASFFKGKAREEKIASFNCS